MPERKAVEAMRAEKSSDQQDTDYRDFDAWRKKCEEVQREYDHPDDRVNMVKLAHIEALLLLERLAQKPVERGARSDVTRRAFAHLQWCTDLGAAPPPALTKLLGDLLDVKPAIGQTRNRKKFEAAALFKAEHPDATATAVKNAVGVNSLQIKEWLRDPLFEATGAYQLARKMCMNTSSHGGGT